MLFLENDDVDAISVQRTSSRIKIANPIVREKEGIKALEFLKVVMESTLT
jgi:hypothetical protein